MDLFQNMEAISLNRKGMVFYLTSEESRVNLLHIKQLRDNK